MPARVPLDVDLEDKLLYGLTPMRLAYLLVTLVAGFTMWSSQWAPTLLRGCAAAIMIGIGAAAAWGRWRSRAADDWAIDIAVFVMNNHRMCSGRRLPSRWRPMKIEVPPGQQAIDLEPLAEAA
jgi:hypothetical protein